MRGEAFFFMNQLGKKLRNNVCKNRFLHMKTLKGGNMSNENHHLGSGSSQFCSEHEELSSPDVVIPMSPIKRRKEIINPTLNNEQCHFLDLCSIYKSEDFLSFNNYQPKQQRNASATPMRNNNLISKNAITDDDTRSCTKLETKKAIHNSEIKQVKPATTEETNLCATNDISRNMIKLDFFNTPKRHESSEIVLSPKKGKKKLKKRKKKVQIVSDKRVNSLEVSMDILAGLSSILQEMDKSESLRVKPKKLKMRHSSSINDSSGGDSVSKSPPRARRKRAQPRKVSQAVPKARHSKLKTFVNLETIVAGLDLVMEEGEY